MVASAVELKNTERQGCMINMVELKDEERQICEVWTRVMGYHRPVSQFNPGKKSEHYERLHFREPGYFESRYE